MGSDPAILAKKKQTNRSRFSVDHPMQLSTVRDKIKQSFLDRHGVDNPSKCDEVKDKMKRTFINKYGVDNPSKNKDIIEKIRISAVARFADPSTKKQILLKRKNTCLDTFGVATNKHCHIPIESIRLMKDLEWLTEQHTVLNKSCQQIANELGVSATPILCFLTQNGINVQRHQITQVHREIAEFIGSIYTGPITNNDRSIISPKEIDIYLPLLRIGFEINGVYWHSEEKGKDRFYHLNKTKQCEEQHVHLIHIYDTEWYNTATQQIIKSKIRHLLGKSNRVFARKCTVGVVPTHVATQFLEQNHLQGQAAAKYKFGLYSAGNELIAIATIGKSRYNKKYKWELIRYCSKTDTTVVGGLSKLLSFAATVIDLSSLISYADRRWTMLTNTNLYETTGFTLLNHAAPNYKYFKINEQITLLSRNQFQKHMLSSKLPEFDEQLSEYENMSMNGYYRIWDCGNLVYGRN